jgi:hypothetical protein
MTDTKHTPGPWCVDDDGFTIKSLNGIARHPEIAEVFGSDWQENARLIAAAPDLLSFAEFVRDLAKAEGNDILLDAANEVIDVVKSSPNCNQENGDV